MSNDDKETAAFIKEAERQGWVVVRTTNHNVLQKDGKNLIVPKSGSDWRGTKNLISDFRRLGGVWPPPPVVRNGSTPPELTSSQKILALMADGKERTIDDIRRELPGIALSSALVALQTKGAITTTSMRNSQNVYKLAEVKVAQPAPKKRPNNLAVFNQRCKKVQEYLATHDFITSKDYVALGLASGVKNPDVGASITLTTMARRKLLTKMPRTGNEAIRYTLPSRARMMAKPAPAPEPVKAVTLQPTQSITPIVPASRDTHDRYVELLFKRAENASGTELTELLSRIEKVVGS